eukprot:GHRR01008193.1.p1 GENE.GHRR01008193.1~~GHRR01008193.1.p1  ORF type:complete len:535 (+),score=155.63 GHRR01008193.1:141-1745(+)
MDDAGDFESLLDEALGIQAGPNTDSPAAASGAKDIIMGSSAAYDQASGPSPVASPSHTVYASPCSPCWSSSSVQMHADVGYDTAYSGSGAYSPVREYSSSPPQRQYPLQAFEQHAAALQQSGQHNACAAVANTSAVAAGSSPTCFSRCHSYHRVGLDTVPREVHMRVLCFLPADALTALSQTCRHFNALCNEPVLWRRLFCHRWGKKVRQNNQLSWKVRYMERDLVDLRAANGGNLGWAGQPMDVMQQIFIQAHIAKRQQALPQSAVDDLMLVEDDEVAAKVMAWRKSRGFDRGTAADATRPADLCAQLPAGCLPRASETSTAQASGSGRSVSLVQRHRLVDGPQAVLFHRARTAPVHQQLAAVVHPKPANSNASRAAGCHSDSGIASSSSGRQWDCVHDAASTKAAAASAAASNNAKVAGVKRPRQRRRWTQISNVFCDEVTGWVHVCDETCSEKIIEPSSGLLVCPISGHVSDRMMTCAEEAEEEGDMADEGKGQQDDEWWGGDKGRLARAFAAGYYCSNEEELLRTCGVRL